MFALLGAAANAAGDAPSAPLFDRIPGGAWLAALDAAIVLEADTVQFGEFELDQVRLPFEVSDGTATLQGGAAKTAGTDLDIDGRYAFATNTLSLDIDGGHLRLAGPERGPGPFFGDEQLVPDWWRHVDASIDLRFDDVTRGELVFSDVDAVLQLGPAAVSADLAAVVGAGEVTAKLEHVYASETTRITATGAQIALAAIPWFTPYVTGATFDFDAALDGHGATQRAFAAGLNASVAATVGPGTLNNLELDQLTRNVLSLTLRTIVPYKNESPRATLECAALQLGFEAGVARTDRALALRTDKLVLLGSGAIDLRQEHVSLKLQPQVRRGIPLGPADDARTVSIEGPFAAPELSAESGGLLHESLALGTSWATNPLSRAAGSVFDWAQAPAMSCRELLQAGAHPSN